MSLRTIKGYILGLLSCILLLGSFSAAQIAPSFDRNFANHLTDDTPDQYGRVETVFNLCIDKNKSLMENIRRLFFPSPYTYDIGNDDCAAKPGGILRDVIRIAGFLILFVYLVLGTLEVLAKNKSPEDIKKFTKTAQYLGFGALIFFGATWILGSALSIENIQGSTDLVERLENNVLFQVLAFLKGLAFFVAIIMLAVFGFKIMAAADQEEKIKQGRKGILYVIGALILIKIIDFIFYIAQTPNFTQQASDFIVDIAVVLGYVLGVVFMLSIFYAGFLFLTSAGDEERVKKAKNIILGVFLGAVVIFLFLLIVFQIFKEFA